MLLGVWWPHSYRRPPPGPSSPPGRRLWVWNRGWLRSFRRSDRHELARVRRRGKRSMHSFDGASSCVRPAWGRFHAVVERDCRCPTRRNSQLDESILGIDTSTWLRYPSGMSTPACSACGRSLSATESFCPDCGVSARSAPAVVRDQPTAAAEEAPASPAAPAGTKPKNAVLGWFVVGLLAMNGVGGGGCRSCSANSGTFCDRICRVARSHPHYQKAVFAWPDDRRSRRLLAVVTRRMRHCHGAGSESWFRIRHS